MSTIYREKCYRRKSKFTGNEIVYNVKYPLKDPKSKTRLKERAMVRDALPLLNVEELQKIIDDYNIVGRLKEVNKQAN